MRTEWLRFWQMDTWRQWWADRRRWKAHRSLVVDGDSGERRPRRPISPAWGPAIALFVIAGAVSSAAEQPGDAPTPVAGTEEVTVTTPAGVDGATTTTSTSTSTTAPATTASTSVTSTTAIPPTTTTTTTAVPSGFAVLSITDGDTFRASVDGLSEPVRIIGINAPEDDECMATEATEFLASLIAGESVRLETDVSDRDRFDRLLRHVWLSDALVAVELVRSGFAIARSYPPDTAMDAVLAAAQEEAQDAKAGMWAPDACGPESEGSITIDAYVYDAPGNDNFNLNEEWVRFRNTGASTLDLTGWAVKDESATHRYQFASGFTLASGATVTLYTGCGDDTATDLYWCNTGSAIWNNSGDTIFVLDPNGNIVVSESY